MLRELTAYHWLAQAGRVSRPWVVPHLPSFPAGVSAFFNSAATSAHSLS